MFPWRTAVREEEGSTAISEKLRSSLSEVGSEVIWPYPSPSDGVPQAVGNDQSGGASNVAAAPVAPSSIELLQQVPATQQVVVGSVDGVENNNAPPQKQLQHVAAQPPGGSLLGVLMARWAGGAMVAQQPPAPQDAHSAVRGYRWSKLQRQASR